MPTFINFVVNQGICSVAVVLFDVTMLVKMIGQSRSKELQLIGKGLNFNLDVGAVHKLIFCFLITQTRNGLGKYFLSGFCFCIVC